LLDDISAPRTVYLRSFSPAMLRFSPQSAIQSTCNAQSNTRSRILKPTPLEVLCSHAFEDLRTRINHQAFRSAYLEVELDVQGDGGLAEDVALEVEQEAVQPPLGRAPVKELAARLQQRQHQPDAEHVRRRVQQGLLQGDNTG
jgi:hypothetical protein